MLPTQTYTVNSATPVRVKFATTPSTSATTTSTFAQSAVVQVLDAADNVVTGYLSSVTLEAFLDSGCSVPVDGRFEVNAATQVPSSGVATYSQLAYRKTTSTLYFKASSGALVSDCTVTPTVVSPGTPTQLIAKLPNLTVTEGFTQNASLAITGTPTAQEVGTAFDVEIRAVDDWFNIVSTDTREVSISTSDPRDTQPAAENLVNGVATFQVINTTATSSGVSHLVTPASTDTLLTSVTSKAYTVNALAASQLIVVLPGQSLLPGWQGSASAAVTGTVSEIVAGTAFSVTVMAVDTYFNKISSFAGDVDLLLDTATDDYVSLPSMATFSSGQAVATLTHKTFGSTHQLNAVSDLVLTENLFNPYTVKAAPATKFLVMLPGQTYAPGSVNCADNGGTVSAQTSGVQFKPQFARSIIFVTLI